MVERIVYALLYLCGLALGFYLILWVLGAIGLSLPPMVVHIFTVMMVLVAILVLYRLFAGSIRWWPNPPGP